VNVTQGIVRVLTAPPVARLFRPLVRDAVPIFMLHRFVDPELGSHGLDPRVLRAQLAYLRKNKFDLLSVSALTCDTSHNRSSRPAVAFTVDDGYTDFATVAAPVFAEFDCPVTVFVVTSTMDDNAWLWWDRVTFAFASTTRTSVRIEIHGRLATYRWSNARERATAEAEFTEQLKTVPDPVKLEILGRLGELFDVEIPRVPPRDFATMSWHDLRRFPANGLVSFGPHTVTHPILPQASDTQSAHEILGSWERLRAECPAATPVFCYPNGAYSAREVTTFLGSGLIGALTSEFRYASRCAFSDTDLRRRFAVPRVASHDELRHFVQIVNGIERVKLGARRGRDGWSTVGARS
jgi:peptidoglycan/xylan/chitin deacetylase (PgdA/CDA1 family)